MEMVEYSIAKLYDWEICEVIWVLSIWTSEMPAKISHWFRSVQLFYYESESFELWIIKLRIIELHRLRSQSTV